MRAAVILSGCGVFDGSEIHESVSLLIHLSRAGVEYDCFAPNINQAHVINHLTQKPVETEMRNVLVESARIARGAIRPLEVIVTGDYDAAFFPGGFGAAKNLCDFASKGAECSVQPEVEKVIRAFHLEGKPIGLCCIAPVLAARVLGRHATGPGGSGVRVTIGNDPGTAEAIEAMGAVHVDKRVTEACVDVAHRVVTAPAYMYEAPVHEVYEGIGAMVENVLELAAASQARKGPGN